LIDNLHTFLKMHERVRSYRQDLVSPSSLNSTRIARLSFYCQIPDI